MSNTYQELSKGELSIIVNENISHKIEPKAENDPLPTKSYGTSHFQVKVSL